MTLSDAQRTALLNAQKGILTSQIPDKSEKDVFGEPVPGLRVYKGLEAKGLLFFTEEEPIDVNGEPFYFTPCVHLTEDGEKILK